MTISDDLESLGTPESRWIGDRGHCMAELLRPVEASHDECLCERGQWASRGMSVSWYAGKGRA